MPQEQTGVKDPAAGGGKQDAGSSTDSKNAAGATDQPKGDGDAETVPYERFSEVNKRMQEAERQTQTLAEQNRQLMQTVLMQRNQPAVQAKPDQASEQTPEEKVLEDTIRGSFGDDPEGKKAADVVMKAVRLAELRATKAGKSGDTGGISEQKIAEMINNAVGGIRSSLYTDTVIQQWSEKGLVSTESAPVLKALVNAQISVNPGWAANDNNLNLLISNLYTTSLANGTISLPSKTGHNGPNRPGNASISPGGGGPSDTGVPDEMEIAEQIRARFPSLANKDPKKLAESLKIRGLPGVEQQSRHAASLR